MHKRIPFAILSLACILALLCFWVWSRSSDSGLPKAVAAARRAGTPVPAALIDADNDFGFRLFRQIAGPEASRNLFLSPVSIAIALQMTYNGAHGHTQQAMAQTLGLRGMSREALNTANAALLASLQDPDPSVRLDIVNSLWFRNGHGINPAFVQRDRDVYGAELGDLAGAPDNINAWVNTKTHGKITQILQPEDIRAAPVSVLVNAIYIKGTWTTEFKSSSTHPATFTLADGSQKTCSMMHESGTFRYLRGDHFQAVSLPYGTGRMSMVLFLPTDISLASFLTELTPANWEPWRAAMREIEGDVALPRFRLESAVSLKEALKAMGMNDAFDGNADFTDMFPGGGVWIDNVRHKTYVEVNEQGTEAAASTAVMMAKMSVPMHFHLEFDHPFLCALCDNKTGAILFLGDVFDPA